MKRSILATVAMLIFLGLVASPAIIAKTSPKPDQCVLLEFQLPNPYSYPGFIEAYGEDRIVFTENADRIGMLSLSPSGAGYALTEWDVTPGAYPTGMALNDTKVYFSENHRVTVGCLNLETGELVEWDIGTTPNAIAIDGNYVYTCAMSASKIVRLDVATGIAVEWRLQSAPWQSPGANTMPLYITVHDGMVYFTEAASFRVSRLDPGDGSVVSWDVCAAGFPSSPWCIEVYKDGVYFTSNVAHSINRLDPATSMVTEWVVPLDTTKPSSYGWMRGLTMDGKGIYFAEVASDKVAYIDSKLTGNVRNASSTQYKAENASVPVNRVDSVALRHDYALTAVSSVSEATSDGTFLEWALPVIGSGPWGIAIDDKGIAFTERYGDRIGIIYEKEMK